MSELKSLAAVAVVVIGATVAVLQWRERLSPVEVWAIAPMNDAVDVTVIGSSDSGHAANGRVAMLQVSPGHHQVKITLAKAATSVVHELEAAKGDTTWVLPADPKQCLVQVDVSSMYGHDGRSGKLKPRVIERHRGGEPMQLAPSAGRPYYGVDLDLFPETLQKGGIAVLVGQVPCDQLDGSDTALFASLAR